MAAIITPFQKVIYVNERVKSTLKPHNYMNILPDQSLMWYVRNLSLTLAFSIALFFFAMRIFDKAQGNFAEEL